MRIMQGGLYINFKKGEQTLNGSEAVSYLRFRNDRNGDIGRIGRQQTFLAALGDKILNAGYLFKAPGLLRQLKKNVRTDMSFTKMMGLAKQFSGAFRAGNINKGSIPGAVALIDGISYWRPDIVSMDGIVESVLLGFESEFAEEKSEGVALKVEKEKNKSRPVTIKEVSRITEQAGPIRMPGVSEAKRIRVEILNGNGVKGGAKTAAEFLEKKGFKITRFDNSASYRYEMTKVVDWKGNIEKALVLATMLNIDPKNIVVYDRPKKPLDITLVLGKDWQQLIKSTKKGVAL